MIVDMLQERIDYTSFLIVSFKVSDVVSWILSYGGLADSVAELNQGYDRQNLAAMEAAISKIDDAGPWVMQFARLVTLEGI